MTAARFQRRSPPKARSGSTNSRAEAGGDWGGIAEAGKDSWWGGRRQVADDAFSRLPFSWVLRAPEIEVVTEESLPAAAPTPDDERAAAQVADGCHQVVPEAPMMTSPARYRASADRR